MKFETAQADPMPTAVIWGCLKAVVDASACTQIL